MIEPWLYPALTGVAVLTGFIDAIAGGGGLIMMPALLTAGLPPAQLLAALQAVRSTLGLGTGARRVGPDQPPNADERRLLAEVPPHHGR